MCLLKETTYCQAINEALRQTMETDSSVFIIGQGVRSPWYVGQTCLGLSARFGESRVMDTPVSENGITGAAVGTAIAGMKPIVVHPRMDFMLYAFDPIINEAANWFYMNGGKIPVPVVFWGIINRYGEQAAQHSQALHGIFSHVPGLKVVMPSTPYDAKGLMIAAINDLNPVVYIDDRLLYDVSEPIPETMYEVPIGKGIVRKPGRDVTVVSISLMSHYSVSAAASLMAEGIDAEVIDLRSAKPIDSEIVISSVIKTGRLLVVDGGWRTCGWASEVSAIVSESAFSRLKAPVRRLTLPDCPAPASRALESEYYISIEKITAGIRDLVKGIKR